MGKRSNSYNIWERWKIVEQNLGIRIKGASTRNNAGKGFNLHAKKNMENQ